MTLTYSYTKISFLYKWANHTNLFLYKKTSTSIFVYEKYQINSKKLSKTFKDQAPVKWQKKDKKKHKMDLLKLNLS